jgi:hypothetical protein
MLLGRVLYHGYIFCRGFLGPNTVYSPPFRTEVSSFYVFFLVSNSIICPAVIIRHKPMNSARSFPVHHYANRQELLDAFHNPFKFASPFAPSPYLHLCLPRDVNIEMCPIAFGKRFSASIAHIRRTQPINGASVSIAQIV